MSGEPVKAIVIGGSAGAVQALLRLLPALPADYPLPVAIVIHVPPDRENALVPLFQSKCQVEVKEAEDKEPMRPGVVYFAPSDYHLFDSAADAFGPALTAVVLTGANHYGAAGLKSVVDAGGVAVVEDPDGAYATAMPTAALAACPDAITLKLDAVASYLLSLGTV
jgi:two-component system, chemotaxis family, protein-glutamate methylesterase/glutaminase